MPDRVFLDTNVLIYAFATDDARQEVALGLLHKGGAIGVQSLNEFANVVTRKWKVAWPEALDWLGMIQRLCEPVVPVTTELHHRAVEIAREQGYHIYDALMLAAALQADRDVFYSEDLHDGHRLHGMVIRNPFAEIKKARR